LGAYFPPSLFDTPFGYEEFAGKDGLIGHAGMTVFDDTPTCWHGPLRDGVLRHRILRQMHPLPHRLDARRRDAGPHRQAATPDAIPLLTDLCNTMKSGSLCALGGLHALSGDERPHPFPR
jgi:formate dehydrogenase iron-sulfur subunit